MNSDSFLPSFQAHCHFPAIPKVADTMLYSRLMSQHLQSIDHTALSLVNDGAVTLLVHKYSMHRAYRATIQLWLRRGLGCVGGRRRVRLTERNSRDVSRHAGREPSAAPCATVGLQIWVVDVHIANSTLERFSVPRRAMRQMNVSRDRPLYPSGSVLGSVCGQDEGQSR